MSAYGWVMFSVVCIYPDGLTVNGIFRIGSTLALRVITGIVWCLIEEERIKRESFVSFYRILCQLFVNKCLISLKYLYILILLVRGKYN